MGASGWTTIKRLGQCGGAVFFYINIAVLVREFLTRPDRDVFVEMIGSVVSLHSLYLGAAIGSTILALWLSWSGVWLATGIYRRWKDKRIRNSPSGKFRRLHDVVVREFKLTERDIMYEDENLSSRSKSLKYSEREILRFTLSKCEVRTPDPGNDCDKIWHKFLTNLAPLSAHGRVDEARMLLANFEKRR